MELIAVPMRGYEVQIHPKQPQSLADEAVHLAVRSTRGISRGGVKPTEEVYCNNGLHVIKVFNHWAAHYGQRRVSYIVAEKRSTFDE